jgi:hypothetical protein
MAPVKVAARSGSDNGETVLPRKAVEIKAPSFQILELEIKGTAPLVQNKFSNRTVTLMKKTQEEGSKAKGKKFREPKDFKAIYQEAMHTSKEGWHGIHAGAFRNAMISACRTVGYKMTHAKLAAFVLADGFDKDDGTPLVRLYGEPHEHTAHVRNDNGSVDIRMRPMWDEWSAVVRIRFDADMFSGEDVVNLMMRVGMQVGIGEGRPDSKTSAGMGWGMFTIANKKETEVAI